MSSLSRRLLASVSLLLIFFFGLTIFALDLVFRSTGERAIRDVLEIQLVALIAAVDEVDSNRTLSMPDELPEPRFANPGSGLYGELTEATGRVLWRSDSAVGTAVTGELPLLPGERRFVTTAIVDGEPVLALSLGVQWEFADGRTRDYVFSVAESLDSYYAQVAKFRRQLLGWFLALMAALLISQAVLLRWVLRPLRQAASEVLDIEAGRRQQLGDRYPTELRGLTSNMNALIQSERARVAKYHDTLTDLAHSLKTPLAVMRSVLEDRGLDADGRATLGEQVERMDRTVGYHLRRAATKAGTGLGLVPVEIGATLRSLCAALDKVYAEKSPTCELTTSAEEALFYGDSGDLTEVLGNLLDNAYKWCTKLVRVTVERLSDAARRRSGFRLAVEDDGPGISIADRAHVLQRGTRLDERMDGQGIGLAVVQDVVALHGGSLQIEDSPLGGARFVVTVPPQ